MKHVLFICTGNICRSPMAEGLFRDLVKGRKDIAVGSAGIGAVSGQLPSVHSVEVMDELGIDINGVRSRPITPEMVRRSDFIFCMTYGHLDSMLLLFPEAADKTFLVREFENEVPVIAREIPDPIGACRDTYRHCRDQIAKALPRLLDFILSAIPEPVAKPKKVFLAADQEGVALKASVREWLRRREIPVEDCGPFSRQGSGSPDYAGKVARAVARGEASCGVLICNSGVGMSIAANKVSGARAALVRDPDGARASRRDDDANILCLAAREMKPQRAIEILEAWFDAGPSDGSPQDRDPNRASQNSPNAERQSPHRAYKMESLSHSSSESSTRGPSLSEVDPAIAALIQKEGLRQSENIELIASENFTSRAVIEAQGSVLTNKYAEGYPGRRWYGGCEHVDEIEQLAIDRAKQLFGAEYANVQPHSGSQANMAVYFAFIKPGDTILTMDLSHGGHLTHGNKMNFSGRFYNVVHYGVSQETETIDYDALAKQAAEHKPKLITAGASAYPRIIDFKRLSEIAQSVGALLFIDMAHIAGLVAAGVHPSPVPYADFVTTTTHKTLRGPRGGLILAKEKYAKELDSQVFPGIQGGPLMHVIAAKAVCLGEALQPAFKAYQQQVVDNAKALCEGLKKNGYRILSGTTENHLMLVDLRPKNLNGKEAQETLDQAGITVNKNAIPFDTVSPFKGGGIRLGTPAVTTRGMKTDEMFDIANLIDEALVHRGQLEKLEAIRVQVRDLTARFPLPY